MKTIEQNDAERRRVPQRPTRSSDAGFTSSTSRASIVLVQSKTLTVDDPAFRAVATEASRDARTPSRKVTKLRSPLAPGNAGLISTDGHSALIQFSPKGTLRRGRRSTSTRSSPRRQGAEAHPGLLRRRGRRASTDKALDAMFNRQLAKAGHDLDPAHARHPAARARLARRAPDPAAPRAHRRRSPRSGLVALPSQIVPMDERSPRSSS